MSARRGHVCGVWQFRAGDPAPEGYLAWHTWADVQHKAGLRQARCGRCGRYRYAQELAQQEPPLCLECAATAGQAEEGRA